MSTDDTNTGESTPAANDQDPIKQIKGEMNRKLDKQNEQITSLLRQQAELVAAIQNAQKPQRAPSTEPTESIADLMYSSPEKAAARIRQEAVAEARAAMEATLASQAQQQAVNQVIVTMADAYPELNDSDSELIRVTKEILGSIPENERRPHAYEYAINKAATSLDMKPRSKREDSDGFVSASASPHARRTKARSDAQIIDNAKDQASVFGLDFSNPKVKAAYLEVIRAKGIK